MSEPLLRTEPPSDRQLAFLAKLCKERGLPMPAPASFTEASLLIDEVREREYHPSDDDAEWLARVRYEQGD